MLSFLAELFRKSNMYALVWSYILSRIDKENKDNKISIFEILSNTKSKKNMLYIIIKFGIDYTNSNDIGFHFLLKNNYLYVVHENSIITDKLGQRKKRTSKNTSKTVNNPKKVIRSKPETVVSPYLDEIDKIIEHLNSKINGIFSPNQKTTIELIEKLFNSGYELQDFINVIDLKTYQWINTTLAKNLKPTTLFEESKFESYQNELITQKSNKNTTNTIKNTYDEANKAKEFLASRDSK